MLRIVLPRPLQNGLAKRWCSYLKLEQRHSTQIAVVPSLAGIPSFASWDWNVPVAPAVALIAVTAAAEAWIAGTDPA